MHKDNSGWYVIKPNQTKPNNIKDWTDILFEEHGDNQTKVRMLFQAS